MPERSRKYKEYRRNGKEQPSKGLIDKIFGRGRQRLFRIGTAAIFSVAFSAVASNFCVRPSSQETYSQELISQFYPELAGRSVQSSDEFTVHGKTVRVLNFTASLFDAQNAIAKYEYFEKIPQEFDDISLGLPGENIIFSLQNQPTADRVVFLVPFNQKSPPWSRMPSAIDYAGTGIDKKSGVKITYIKIPDQQLRELNDNKFKIPFDPNDNFDIEVCQSSLAVNHTDPRLKELGQEMVCNGFGVATSAVTKGIPHSEYQGFIKLISMVSGEPFQIFPHEFYDKIPRIKKVLSTP